MKLKKLYEVDLFFLRKINHYLPCFLNPKGFRKIEILNIYSKLII